MAKITDAARLDWLAQCGAEIVVPYTLSDGFRFAVTLRRGEFAGLKFRGRTLRQAIDEAIEQTGRGASRPRPEPAG